MACFAVLFICHNVSSQNIKFQHITTSDGLTQSGVRAIYQDHTGYMWFGTLSGLNRYDAYSISNYIDDINDSNTIANNSIHQITQDKENIIWISTDKGITSYNPINEKFTNYAIDSVLSELLPINQLILIDSATILMSTTKDLVIFNPITKIFKNIPFKEIERSNILALKHFENKIFISTKEGLYNIVFEKNSMKLQSLNSSINEPILGFEVHLKKLYAFSKQSIYLYNSAHQLEVFKSLKSNLNEINGVISTIHFDHRDVLWIGTQVSGLYRYNTNNGLIDRFTHSSNLSTSISSNTIMSITSDQTGILWVGTRLGINIFDSERQNFNHYQTIVGNEKIDNSKVWSIFSENNNEVWIGGDNGLSKIQKRNNAIETYRPILYGNHANNGIYSIKAAFNGFWVGTEEGLQRFDSIQKKFIPIPLSESVNKSRTYCIKVLKDGRVFSGNRQGLLEVKKNGSMYLHRDYSPSLSNKNKANIFRCVAANNDSLLWFGTEEGVVSFSPYTYEFKNRIHQDAFNDNFITSLWLDKQVLWIGTRSAGVYQYNIEKKSISNISEKNGLANNAVNGLLEDENANLWISTNKGLSRYQIGDKIISNFTESDGLQSNEFNSGAVFKSANNELYFGGINGFNVFLPNEIGKNKYPPKMVFTAFNLFNKKVPISKDGILTKSISATNQIDIDYDEKVISFEFAALHYSNPKKNQHAYKLEGFDKDWVNIGNTRIATYTNLNAGKYTFKVKGSNSDNVWSDPIEISITIHPPFWATWWFRIIFIFGVLGFIFYNYQNRIKRIRRQKRLLESQVKQRTIEIIKQKEEVEIQKKLLEEEKEKTEKLLLNVLPKETAEELKNRGRAKARNYTQATVMFADFEGFTQLAENYKPQDLVARLDRFFIKFDEITEKFDVEKIKTVGDAYLCAGGLPIRNKSNPIDTVLAALHFQKIVADERELMIAEGREPWKLRVGIHTGELIAGVVGIKRFAYDIWGDTVNIASRLETACETGMINISGATYDAVVEFFECEYRGRIPAKNKGDIDMYYVHRIKAELSENEDGINPNEAFEHYVNLKLYSNINYRNAEKYIIKRLKEDLPEGLTYHGIHHTKDVCESVERLAIWEGIRGEDLYLLKTAALFHDAGFVESYESNEPIGAKMSKEMLPDFGYTKEQINKVIHLIEATKWPHNPKTHLQKLMCDADLDYLGRPDFFQKASTLRKELERFGKIKTEKDWDELQVKFLSAHKFFTKSAILRRAPEKEKHLSELKKILSKHDEIT